MSEFELNGYTIYANTSNGIYSFVKDWRKNKAIWVRNHKLTADMVYKNYKTLVNSFNNILKTMPEYADDELELVGFKDGLIVDVRPIIVNPRKLLGQPDNISWDL